MSDLWFARLVTVALAVVAVRSACARGAADYEKGEMRRLTGEYAQVLAGGSDALIAKLKGINDQVARDKALVAVGTAAENGKAHATIGEAFDKLMAAKDLDSTILAADLLLKTVDMTTLSAYGASKEIKAFPADLCDRAVKLLNHPDPVVQAMGEWMLALRVKKLNSSSKSIKDLLRPGITSNPWYVAWLARDAKFDLQDDYARQLVHLNRHRTTAGVGQDIERVDGRIRKMLAASDSRRANSQMAEYTAALASAKQAAAGKDLLQAHKAYIDYRKAARAVIAAARADFPSEGIAFFTDYAITGGVWNVNVSVTNGTNIPFGNIYMKKSANPADSAESLLDRKALGDGSIRGIDLSWEVDKLLFSYWMQPIDPTLPRGWDATKNAHLFEMDLKSRNVKQLTNSPGNDDIEPCFLPDGSYLFSSDRSSFGNQCAGPFLQDKRCTSLFRLDPRKSREPIAISNNKDFDRHAHVLNDGTVAFMHWEYQERGLYNSHTVWRCRPDGTNMDAFYKQHINVPLSIRDARQAPDSELCVATAQGHHDAHDGPVILFNPSMGINNEEAMWNLTPGTSPIERGLGPLQKQIVPEGGVENGGGYYINPFPMSEKAFLVGHCMTANEDEFAIYYIDVWGNRELLHKDDEMSCFMPYPLRQRQRPPVVADTVDPKATCATVFVENVYTDLPGVKKGDVKYLRISQSLPLPAPVDLKDSAKSVNHLHWLPGDATASHFAYWAWSPSRTVGIVDVQPDGSAYFKVPAGTPVYLQALDANYCEVRRMRTSFTLQRGETRGCIGCHESRLQTVAMRPAYTRQTLDKGPQTPVVASWGDTAVLDFRKDIQPILDKHCVSCHGQEKPAGGIELTKREIGGFAQSYRTLFGLKPADATPINELSIHLDLHPEAKADKLVEKKEATAIHARMATGAYPNMLVSISDRLSDASITQPYQFGSNKSKLIRKLLDDPEHKTKVASKLDKEEWMKLVTWIDYNANYYSTVIDKSNYQKSKQLVRVPIYVSSPWIPGDTNPGFYNTVSSSVVPQIPPYKAPDPK